MSNHFVFPPPPPPPTKPHTATTLTENNESRYESTTAWRGRAPHHSGHGLGRGSFDSAVINRLPPGSYVNPNFWPVSQHRTSGNTGHDQAKSSATTPHTFDSTTSVDRQAWLDRTSVGHKRKLEALRGPRIATKVKPGPETAPAVPSFGSSATITAQRSQHTQVLERSRDASSKSGRSLFGIGVSQDGHLSSESENDDHDNNDDEEEEADEEATYAQLGNKLKFEYDGKVVTLESEADLMRWQQERRKRWPTNSRIAEQHVERRAVGEERKRLLEGAYALTRPSWATRSSRQINVAPIPHPNSQEDTVTEGSIVTKQPENVAIKTNSLLGMSMYDSDEEVDNTQPSDDEPPEETSSRSVQPAAPEIEQRPACRFYFATGRCKQGEACEFRHEARDGQPAPIPRTSQRTDRPRITPKTRDAPKKGIHQLLMKQEDMATDKLALQVIQHLGNIGFFNAASE